MLIFYSIGAIIALIIGLFLYVKEEDKENAQIEMIVPMTLLSWITVVIFILSKIKIHNC